ncbi:MAG TPA: phosphoribosylamine--glycine ligase [Bryobacteraceae bacterium]|jgi:phosphoribosylamine--glycine ligase
MNILVIGSGGREHALAWRLAQSPSRPTIYAAPGNPGIAQVATCLSVPDAMPETLLAAAESVAADLTVVGPEAPLVDGVVDCFRAAGKLIVGPTAEAARLEGSKVYAKQFFATHRIPTARFAAVSAAHEAADAFRQFGFPVVVKTDGLAAGKGVVIAQNRTEAEAAYQSLGPHAVIEEFLIGEEVSFIVLSDGRRFAPFAAAQDHKAAYDGDQGPNTGGMGAYSDDRILTPAERETILDRIIAPTVSASGFTGFLYAGLMMTADGPKLLEYNVRMGDPETQPLMHRLQCDFAQALLAAARGDLGGVELRSSANPAVCVVMASVGYPGKFDHGIPISGIEEAEAEGATVFQAGTRLKDGKLVTAGGRVLGITASASDLPKAITQAYAAAGQIMCRNIRFRRDIGQKGLKRYNKS